MFSNFKSIKHGQKYRYDSPKLERGAYMSLDYQLIGKRIKKRRDQVGLTQEKLAEACGLTGIRLDDPSKIVAVTRETNYLLPYDGGKRKYRYVVTAVDRFHNENQGKSKKVKL